MVSSLMPIVFIIASTPRLNALLYAAYFICPLYSIHFLGYSFFCLFFFFVFILLTLFYFFLADIIYILYCLLYSIYVIMILLYGNCIDADRFHYSVNTES